MSAVEVDVASEPTQALPPDGFECPDVHHQRLNMRWMLAFFKSIAPNQNRRYLAKCKHCGCEFEGRPRALEKHISTDCRLISVQDKHIYVSNIQTSDQSSAKEMEIMQSTKLEESPAKRSRISLEHARRVASHSHTHSIEFSYMFFQGLLFGGLSCRAFECNPWMNAGQFAANAAVKKPSRALMEEMVEQCFHQQWDNTRQAIMNCPLKSLVIVIRACLHSLSSVWTYVVTGYDIAIGSTILLNIISFRADEHNKVNVQRAIEATLLNYKLSKGNLLTSCPSPVLCVVTDFHNKRLSKQLSYTNPCFLPIICGITRLKDLMDMICALPICRDVLQRDISILEALLTSRAWRVAWKTSAQLRGRWSDDYHCTTWRRSKWMLLPYQLALFVDSHLLSLRELLWANDVSASLSLPALPIDIQTLFKNPHHLSANRKLLALLTPIAIVVNNMCTCSFVDNTLSLYIESLLRIHVQISSLTVTGYKWVLARRDILSLLTALIAEVDSDLYNISLFLNPRTRDLVYNHNEHVTAAGPGKSKEYLVKAVRSFAIAHVPLTNKDDLFELELEIDQFIAKTGPFGDFAVVSKDKKSPKLAWKDFYDSQILLSNGALYLGAVAMQIFSFPSHGCTDATVFDFDAICEFCSHHYDLEAISLIHSKDVSEMELYLQLQLKRSLFYYQSFGRGQLLNMCPTNMITSVTSVEQFAACLSDDPVDWCDDSNTINRFMRWLNDWFGSCVDCKSILINEGTREPGQRYFLSNSTL
jgi:hypothetical protein